MGCLGEAPKVGNGKDPSGLEKNKYGILEERRG